LRTAAQTAILDASPRKLRAIVTLALITGARIGEILALRWEHCQDGYMTFWETKNARMRRENPYQSSDRGCAGRPATRTPVGVHEQQDRIAV